MSPPVAPSRTFCYSLKAIQSDLLVAASRYVRTRRKPSNQTLGQYSCVSASSRGRRRADELEENSRTGDPVVTNLRRNGRLDPGVLVVDVLDESSPELDHDSRSTTPSSRRRPRRTYSEVVEQSTTNDRRTHKLLIQTSTTRKLRCAYSRSRVHS